MILTSSPLYIAVASAASIQYLPCPEVAGVDHITPEGLRPKPAVCLLAICFTPFVYLHRRFILSDDRELVVIPRKLIFLCTTEGYARLPIDIDRHTLMLFPK